MAETLGGLAEDTISTIRSLGEAIAQRVNPQDSSTCIKQLFHRVAIALWRGTLAAPPTHSPPLSGRCSLVYFLKNFTCILLFSYYNIYGSRTESACVESTTRHYNRGARGRTYTQADHRRMRLRENVYRSSITDVKRRYPKHCNVNKIADSSGLGPGKFITLLTH